MSEKLHDDGFAFYYDVRNTDPEALLAQVMSGMPQFALLRIIRKWCGKSGPCSGQIVHPGKSQKQRQSQKQISETAPNSVTNVMASMAVSLNCYYPLTSR